MHPVLVDMILKSAIAAVCCFSYREHRLLSLTAGLWVVVGGWAFTLATGQTGTTPIHPYTVLALLALCAIAPLAVVRLGDTILQAPFRYFFCTVGTLFAGKTLGANYMTSVYGGHLNTHASELSAWAAACACVAAIALVALTMRSRPYARHSIQTRLSSVGRGSAIARLIVLETMVLLVLGASTTQAHKGIFDAAETYSIIAVLAVLAARGRPLRAAACAGAIALTAHLLDSQPYTSVPAVPIVLVAFAFAVAVANRPLNRSLGLRANQWAAIGARTGGPWPRVVLPTALVTLLVVGGWQAFRPNDTLVPLRFLSAVGFTALSFVALRLLGIMTIALPAIGGVFVYAFVQTQHSTDLTRGSLLASLVCAGAAYLVVLRWLPMRVALLLDLSLCTGIYHLVVGSQVSGSSNAQLLRCFADARAVYPIALLLNAVLPLAALGVDAAMRTVPGMRAWLRALASPLLGRNHGYRVTAATCLVCVGLATAAGVLSVLAGLVRTVVTVDIVHPGLGLAALAMSHLAHRFGFTKATVFLAAIFVGAGGLLARYGELVQIVIGALLTMSAVLSNADAPVYAEGE